MKNFGRSRRYVWSCTRRACRIPRADGGSAMVHAKRLRTSQAVACSAVVQTGKKWLGPARQDERVFEFLGRYRFAKLDHERDREQSCVALGTVFDDRYDLACRLGGGAYH